MTSGETTSPPKLMSSASTVFLGLRTDLEELIGNLQVWKVDGSVCFFGVVVGEEAGVGKCPSKGVMNHQYSDLIHEISIQTRQVVAAWPSE